MLVLWHCASHRGSHTHIGYLFTAYAQTLVGLLGCLSPAPSCSMSAGQVFLFFGRAKAWHAAQSGMPVFVLPLSKPQAVCGLFVHIHAPRIGIRRQRLPAGLPCTENALMRGWEMFPALCCSDAAGHAYVWAAPPLPLWQTCAGKQPQCGGVCCVGTKFHAPAGTKQASSCSMAALRWGTGLDIVNQAPLW